MITIVSENGNTDDARVREAFFIIEPNQAERTEVGRLLDTGKLTCFVDAVVPFALASDARTRPILEFISPHRCRANSERHRPRDPGVPADSAVRENTLGRD